MNDESSLQLAITELVDKGGYKLTIGRHNPDQGLGGYWVNIQKGGVDYDHNPKGWRNVGHGWTIHDALQDAILICTGKQKHSVYEAASAFDLSNHPMTVPFEDDLMEEVE